MSLFRSPQRNSTDSLELKDLHAKNAKLKKRRNAFHKHRILNIFGKRLLTHFLHYILRLIYLCHSAGHTGISVKNRLVRKLYVKPCSCGITLFLSLFFYYSFFIPLFKSYCFFSKLWVQIPAGEFFLFIFIFLSYSPSKTVLKT